MNAEELNRKMAEKVMGWHEDRARRPYWMDCNEDCQFATREIELDDLGDWEYWNPCGNWAHFGLVLERVWESRRYLRLELIGFRSGLMWALCGARPNGGEAEGADTKPLEAACAAILEAWGDD